MKRTLQISLTVFLVAVCSAVIQSCKKNLSIPDLTTLSVSDITVTSAVVSSNVMNDGGADVTERGVTWSKDPIPYVSATKSESGTGTGAFTAQISGLFPNTTYYVRAYAVNSVGTGYGNVISFTTKDGVVGLATITTTVVTSVTDTSAVSGGTIIEEGNSYLMDWGVCWSTSSNPTILNDRYDMNGTLPVSGKFVANLTGLSPHTTYYVRAYATNDAGTAYGEEKAFTTSGSKAFSAIQFNTALTYGSVSDIDANNYKTIQIGSQIWMAENLKTTKYNDGSAIDENTDNYDWSYATRGGYCWYNNDSSAYKKVFGALYNWLAASSGKLCPAGWRVPNASDLDSLFAYFGGDSLVGTKMKETGILHWGMPNSGADNSSGWTGLPGGVRRDNGLFADIQSIGTWWTSSEGINSGSAVSAYLYNYLTALYIPDYSPRSQGSSVRCIKN